MQEGLCKMSSKRQVLLEGTICEKTAKEKAAKSDHVQEEKRLCAGMLSKSKCCQKQP